MGTTTSWGSITKPKILAQGTGSRMATNSIIQKEHHELEFGKK